MLGRAAEIGEGSPAGERRSDCRMLKTSTFSARSPEREATRRPVALPR